MFNALKIRTENHRRYKRKKSQLFVKKGCIEEAKKIGLEKLLLTCFADNIASAKVIEKNGGIFTKHVEYGGERKRNYLIRIAV